MRIYSEKEIKRLKKQVSINTFKMKRKANNVIKIIKKAHKKCALLTDGFQIPLYKFKLDIDTLRVIVDGLSKENNFVYKFDEVEDIVSIQFEEKAFSTPKLGKVDLIQPKTEEIKQNNQTSVEDAKEPPKTQESAKIAGEEKVTSNNQNRSERRIFNRPKIYDKSKDDLLDF